MKKYMKTDKSKKCHSPRKRSCQLEVNCSIQQRNPKMGHEIRLNSAIETPKRR